MVEGRVARPGIYKYHEDGDVVRELVPRSTLYDPKSLQSLGRVAYTDGHPPEPIDENNVDRFQDGDVGEDVHIGGNEFVRVTAAVRTNEAIRNALSGKRDQLSPGYHAEIKDEAGTHPEFGEFDRIQTKRVYNHLAGVSRARGGPDCAMRTDDADDLPSGARMVLDSYDISWKSDQDEHDLCSDGPTRAEVLQDLVTMCEMSREDAVDEMAKHSSYSAEELRDQIEQDSDSSIGEITVTLDSEDFLMDIDKLQDRLDEIEQKLDESNDVRDEEDEPEEDGPALSEFISDAQKALDNLSKENENLRKKATKLEAKLEGLQEREDGDDEEDEPAFTFDSKEDLVDWQNERDGLKQAGETFQVDMDESMSNMEMKRAIVEDELDKDLEDASDVRVDGLYEGLTERVDMSSRQYNQASNLTENALQEGPEASKKASRESFEKRWKGEE